MRCTGMSVGVRCCCARHRSQLTCTAAFVADPIAGYLYPVVSVALTRGHLDRVPLTQFLVLNRSNPRVPRTLPAFMRWMEAGGEFGGVAVAWVVFGSSGAYCLGAVQAVVLLRRFRVTNIVVSRWSICCSRGINVRISLPACRRPRWA